MIDVDYRGIDQPMNVVRKQVEKDDQLDKHSYLTFDYMLARLRFKYRLDLNENYSSSEPRKTDKQPGIPMGNGLQGYTYG